jgi:hypothetical protein
MTRQNGTTHDTGDGRTDIQAALEAAQELDEQTRTQATRLVARINSLAGDVDVRYERIANDLFETVYDGDVARALSTRGDQPLLFLVLVRCTDDTLHLSRPQLSICIRIGALNRRLEASGWTKLSWSTKRELLPLLGPDLDFDRLAAGVRWVEKHLPSVRALREWVAGQRPGAAREVDTGGASPKVPPFAAAAKVAAIGLGLSKASGRSEWVRRYEKLPTEAQASLVAF